jgi:sugar O-acyltransferase (sialic acid O-acetyltransferase NeuD family)
MKLAILGKGGFAKEVYWQILDNNKEEQIEIFQFEDFMDRIVNNGNLDWANTYKVLVAIGDPINRKKIVEQLPQETIFRTFIHKSAMLLSSDIEIGIGSIVCSNTIITTNVSIGKHSQLNLLSTIGHDCIIGDYFTTAPGAKISGNCKIGTCVYIGTNASVKEKISITSNVTIGLNAGVVKNIEDEGVYVGCPALKVN